MSNETKISKNVYDSLVGLLNIWSKQFPHILLSGNKIQIIKSLINNQSIAKTLMSIQEFSSQEAQNIVIKTSLYYFPAGVDSKLLTNALYEAWETINIQVANSDKIRILL